MRIDEKYIRQTEAAVSNPKSLQVLSDDAYAICEFIENLMIRVDGLRQAVNR